MPASRRAPPRGRGPAAPRCSGPDNGIPPPASSGSVKHFVAARRLSSSTDPVDRSRKGTPMTTTTISLDEATILGFSVHATSVRRTVGGSVSRHLPPERTRELLPGRLQYLESVGVLTADQSKSLQEFVTSGTRPPKPGPMRSVNGTPGEPENVDTI